MNEELLQYESIHLLLQIAITPCIFFISASVSRARSKFSIIKLTFCLSGDVMILLFI